MSDGPAFRMPYGPGTTRIRTFLLHLAGLGARAREDIVARHLAMRDSAEFVTAETMLGETIERSGRRDARDALAGPLLQLVRVNDVPAGTSAGTSHAAGGMLGAVEPDDDVLTMLDPIAEPALAAVLALLVADLLPAPTVRTLYASFADTIPLDRL